MNLRSLLNFIALRDDIHAQEEIKLLAREVEKLTFDTMPNLRDEFKKIIGKKRI
jgi:thymidylate synthase ThyX